MILKLLLVIGIVVTIYVMFFKKSTPLTAQRHKKSASNEEKDTMVECHECGVYVSLEEAILSSGQYYCSQECLKA